MIRRQSGCGGRCAAADIIAPMCVHATARTCIVVRTCAAGVNNQDADGVQQSDREQCEAPVHAPEHEGTHHTRNPFPGFKCDDMQREL